MGAFRARKSDTCSICNKPVNPGDYISWSRKPRANLQARKTYHATCAGIAIPSEPTAQVVEPEPVLVIPTNERCYVPGCNKPAVAGFKGCADCDEPRMCERDCTAAALPGTRLCHDHTPGASKPTAKPMPALTPAPSGNAALDALADALAPRIGAAISSKVDEAQVQAMINAALAGQAPRELTIIVKRGEPVATHTVERAHPMLAIVLRLFRAKKNVFAYGPPGSGKSTGIAQAFEALGLSHSLYCLNPQVSPISVFGYKSPTGEYQATPFYERYTNGGGICFDELDNSAAELQAMLNAALANGRSNFANGNADKHATFLCGGTGNTNGLGGSREFPGRRPMDGAFRDRFAFVYWGYDEAWERSVALTHYAQCDAWVSWIFTARAYARANYPTLHVSPRATFDGADLLGEGFTPEEVADTYVFRGIDADSRTRILNACPLPTVRS